MEQNEFQRNIEIIKDAYSILEKGYAFHNSTMSIQISFFEGLSEEEYKKLDDKLKAVRQDFAKILIIMNCIDKTYSAYQKNEYRPSYISITNDQATVELGCHIEYLFIKYRVILDYIQQILEICIVPRLDEKQKNDYIQIKKSYKKYNYLLNFAAQKINRQSNLINMDWFQKLRIERDFIVHAGATCLVFGDKKELLFKIMTTDALDKEDEYKEEDAFFINDKGLVRYSFYWGLQISKLIVFSELIFEFVLSDSKLSDDARYMQTYLQTRGRSKFVDANDGTEYPDIQDVLTSLLKSILEKSECSFSDGLLSD